jgi:hypothetical protein
LDSKAKEAKLHPREQEAGNIYQIKSVFFRLFSFLLVCLYFLRSFVMCE